MMWRRSSRLPLSAVAQGAQSGGLDDRVAEVIAVLRDDLATAEADPEPDSRVEAIAVVQIDSLLHRDSACQRSRRRAEDRHQAVAQVLDLLASGLGHRLAQDREMAPPHLVGVFGRLTVGQLRRPDDVREEDGQVLRRHRNSHFPTDPR